MKYQYVNREISWLQFNDRVLQEAADESNPLIERVKFLGIFSNNQDAFFRVRVASLHRLVAINKKKYPEKSKQYQAVLDDIYKITRKQANKLTDIFLSIQKKMELHNVFVINETQLSKEQGEYVHKYFQENVRQKLFPIMLKQMNCANHLKDKSIYLGIILHRKNGKQHYAMMKIPTDSVERFVVLPEKNGKRYIILLDDVIRYCLDDVFSVFDCVDYDAYTFKFTRDAELDMYEDVSKSFLEIMSESIRKRLVGSPVRFVYDRNMPKDLLDKLLSKISEHKYDRLIEGGRYHNFKDFMKFPNLLGDEFVYPKVTPVLHKDLIPGKSIFRVLRKKDVLLHYPYHSFQHIIDWLREASIDPKVRSIKITLYRVANDSAVINALINAARNGKNVVVFLELQARFDEQQNIYLSEKLQESGVKIIAAIPGFKIHSKLMIIRRKEDSENVYYGYVGTGNFNESTAKIYTDESLLTSNTKITLDIRKVFELFDASYRQVRFRNLIVSPFSTRNFFMRLIENEIENQKAGKEAWIIVKLNNLADYRMVNKLYKASQAGVKIRLIIRGICVLVPGVQGLSENIEVVSILDKYLEHSRVFAFANSGKPSVFLGSADWMVRNLDRRVEVITPVFDESIKKELLDMLNIQLKDNVKARILDGTFKNRFLRNENEKVRTQWATYDYIKEHHKI